MRDPAHKITGAVEWVDNPDIFRIVWPRSPTFLADECVVGVGFLEVVKNLLLGGEINLCNEVCLSLGLEAEPCEVV